MLERLPKFKMSAFNYKEQATLLNVVIAQVEKNEEEIKGLKEEVIELKKANADLLDLIIPRDKKPAPKKKEDVKTKSKPKGEVDVDTVPPIELT